MVHAPLKSPTAQLERVMHYVCIIGNHKLCVTFPARPTSSRYWQPMPDDWRSPLTEGI